MCPKDVLDHFSCSTRCRGDPRYGMAVPDHHKRLVPVFDGVENVGEVAGCLGGGDVSHSIRLSDRKCLLHVVLKASVGGSRAARMAG